MATRILFLALLVKGEAGERITAFKEYAAAHFQSSRALNSPPHLTLIPPFQYPATQLETLAESLSGFMVQQTLPTVELQGFDCFAPRVIYVAVAPNPALSHFQNLLETFLEQQLHIRSDRQYGFHPHVTVAFKDLREAVFPEAWAHYSSQSYAHTFQPDSIALLQHLNGQWEVLQEFTPQIQF